MPILKTKQTRQMTEGNYWTVRAVGIELDRVIVTLDLYANEAAKLGGGVRMLMEHYPIPKADLGSSTLSSLTADIESWFVANHADFSGGTVE